MENKINIAKLLKDCPTGMELDCAMFEKPVKYMGLTKNETYIIAIKTSCDKIFYLTKEGYLYDTPDSKCVIFPKGKTTWEGFVPPCKFEDGDVLVHTQNQRFIMSIYHKRTTELIITTHCILWDRDEGLSINREICCYPDKTRLATEEEKERLFQVIKDNGYEWNPKTKTLEKITQLNFKDRDDDRFIEDYVTLSNNSLYLDGYPVCETVDVKEIRLATEQEREKLFDVIKARGYYWNNETKTLEEVIEPIFKAGNKIRSKNKKDECFHILHVDKDKHKYILNIKGYCLEFKDQDNYELVPDKFDFTTLKHFDKVLARDSNIGRWDITFYECYDSKNGSFPYRTLGGGMYRQCIPYENNEHLVGLVKDCDEYYKNWK